MHISVTIVADVCKELLPPEGKSSKSAVKVRENTTEEQFIV